MESPTRPELYQKTREDLLKRQLSNNENLSVTFMRSTSTHACFAVLVFAWIGFVASIVVTILSYLTSQQGIARQLELAEQYYLGNNEASLTARNLLAVWTDRFAYISAVAFVCGIILLLVYFSVNAPEGQVNQCQQKTDVRPPAMLRTMLHQFRNYRRSKGVLPFH